MTKHNFKHGDILHAYQLNEMEDAIEELLNSEFNNNINVQSNWDQNDSNAEDFIQNRPFWSQSNTVEWDGSSGEIIANLNHSYLILPESSCNAQSLIGSNITFIAPNGIKYNGVITHYISSNAELDTAIDEMVEDIELCWIDYGYMSGDNRYNNLQLYALFKETSDIVLIGQYYSNSYFNIQGSMHTGGLYAYPLNSDQGTISKIDYNKVIINQKYKSFFESSDIGLNVKVLQIASMDLGLLNQFSAGDILLLYTLNPEDIPDESKE